jgi:hypothetical protein
MVKRDLTGRTIAILLLAFLFAIYTYRDQRRWNRLGREAFLADQSHRFDRSMATPQSLGFILFGDATVFLGIFGTYELAVWGISTISRLLSRGDSNEKRSSGPPRQIMLP